MSAFGAALPELVRDVEARGGYDARQRGRDARATFLATLDGQPVGCATLAAAQVGPRTSRRTR